MKTITTLILAAFLIVPAYAQEKPKGEGTVVNGMRLAKKKEAKPEQKQEKRKEPIKKSQPKK